MVQLALSCGISSVEVLNESILIDRLLNKLNNIS